MSRIIISSKVAEKLSKRLNHHFSSVQEQPVVIRFEMTDEHELNINISSVEGNMTFITDIQKVK